MRIDAALIQWDEWPVLLRRARLIEDAGATGIWVGDHFSHPQSGGAWLDAWPLLGALAVSTSRVHLGPLVSPATLHPEPAMLARHAISIDRISDGRLELGLGSGLPERDYAMAGRTPWTTGERLDHFEEFVALIDRLLRGGLVRHAGKHYQITYADMSPGPVQRPRPPLILAAHGRRGMRLAAKYADGWNTLGGQPQARDQEPRQLDQAVASTRRELETLDAACAEVGRDPRALDRSVFAFRSPVDPVESLDAFDEWVGRYAEIGFAHFILGIRRDADADVLQRVAAARPAVFGAVPEFKPSRGGGI